VQASHFTDTQDFWNAVTAAVSFVRSEGGGEISRSVWNMYAGGLPSLHEGTLPHLIELTRETLDKLVHDELKDMKEWAKKNWEAIESDVKSGYHKKTNTRKRIAELTARIHNLELDIENILMERINDKENRATYDIMIEKRKAEIAGCKTKIHDVQNIGDTLKKRREEIQHNLNLIDEIIADSGISNTHLRMLIDKIQISESEKGLDIKLN
jgi:chromosome segregation ATPase